MRRPRPQCPKLQPLQLVAAGFFTSGATGGGAPAEITPTWANVEFLMHGSARPFIDVSANKYAIVNKLASVPVASSRADLGAGGANGAQRLIVPSTVPLALGTAPWAIVAKVVCGVDGIRVLDSRSAGAGTDGVTVTVQATTYYPFVAINNTTNYGIGGTGLPAGNLAVPNGVETEICFNYDGTTLKCFVGGALSWSHTVSLSVTTGTFPHIGNTPYADNGIINSSVRELMIVKGEAPYTVAYTPKATQSDTGTVLEAGAAVTFANVKLLLHGEGTDGSTTITDSSSSARAATVSGNTQIDTAQFRLGSASILFDGTGDYLTYANSADIVAFPGDFCIEWQARHASLTNTVQQVYYSAYQNSTTGIHFDTYGSGAKGAVRFGYGDTIQIQTQNDAMVVNTWKHAAVFRVGTLLFIAVEGELLNVATNSTSFTSTAAPQLSKVPGFSGAEFNGHLDEFRITKGQSPYVRSFLVQTAAHPDS